MQEPDRDPPLDWPRPEVTVDRQWSVGDYPGWLRAWLPYGIELREDGVAFPLDKSETRRWRRQLLAWVLFFGLFQFVFAAGMASDSEEPDRYIGAALFSSVFLLLMLLFAWLALRMSRRLRRDDPVLRIDDTGLHIDALPGNGAFVSWEAFLGISYVVMDGPKGLMVYASEIVRPPAGAVLTLLRRWPSRRGKPDQVQVRRETVIPSLQDLEVVIATHRWSPTVPQEPETGTLPQRLAAESHWWNDVNARGVFERPPSWRAVFRLSRSRRFATPPEYRRAVLTTWRRHFVWTTAGFAALAAFYVVLTLSDPSLAGSIGPAPLASLAVSAVAAVINVLLSRRPAGPPPMRRIIRSCGRNFSWRLLLVAVAYLSVIVSALAGRNAVATAWAWAAAAVPAALSAPTLGDLRRRSATVRGADPDLLVRAASAAGWHWYW